MLYMDSGHFCTTQVYELKRREVWRWRQLVTSYYTVRKRTVANNVKVCIVHIVAVQLRTTIKM